MINVKAVLSDWKNGLTHSQILKRHTSLTIEQEFAITECSKGVGILLIMQRVTKVKPTMKSSVIRYIMKGYDE